ncbi:hypothetical protein [Nocardia bhagyanarayanae]|uniref:Uncharacterized protein n=1 Tax=Nocardia bhagyanarayanae TaxID=1215925 RepID=A0A543FHM0_9NOCA|nr:hypothetical protein [Nocardia bhagyanarayanae]TQM33276.1 hypothetical protein FB390_4999 [Nocardia bhagyanarayanae]
MVTATMRLTPGEAAAIRASRRHRPVDHHARHQIRAADGNLVARATQDLHVRRLA